MKPINQLEKNRDILRKDFINDCYKSKQAFWDIYSFMISRDIRQFELDFVNWSKDRFNHKQYLKLQNQVLLAGWGVGLSKEEGLYK